MMEFPGPASNCSPVRAQSQEINHKPWGFWSGRRAGGTTCGCGLSWLGRAHSIHKRSMPVPPPFLQNSPPGSEQPNSLQLGLQLITLLVRAGQKKSKRSGPSSYLFLSALAKVGQGVPLCLFYRSKEPRIETKYMIGRKSQRALRVARAVVFRIAKG